MKEKINAMTALLRECATKLVEFSTELENYAVPKKTYTFDEVRKDYSALMAIVEGL